MQSVDSLNEADFNFAVVSPKVHRLLFQPDVKFKIPQTGVIWPIEKLGHAPHVTVFRGSSEGRQEFSIILLDQPELAEGEPFLSNSDVGLLLEHFKIYRSCYLMLCNNAGMDTDELRKEMVKIDESNDQG